MILIIFGLLIGVLIMGGGIYYYISNKADAESRKIYGMTILIGGIIGIGFLIRLILAI